MPYIQINTNISMNNQQKDDLLESTAKLIIILPDKKVERTMVLLNDNQLMYFGNSKEPCMKVSIDVYQDVPFAAKASYTNQLTDVIKEITHIDPARIYLTYAIYSDWGSDGMMKR